MRTYLFGTSRRRGVWCLFAGFALASSLTAARAAEPAAEVDARQQELIDVLRSDDPPAQKGMACKKLAIYGNKAAVPALAALLPDAELCSWARIALEAIPDAAADEALREAAKTLNGRELIGVINSIGVRRDSGAVALLKQRLKDQDPQVVSASAASLGKIGGPEATRILEQALGSAPEAARSTVAAALVRCAEQLLAADKANEAAALYEKIRAADVSKQRNIEAIRGVILAKGPQGFPLLIEQLQSSDPLMFRLGLGVAREVGGKEVAAAVTEELNKVRQSAPSGESTAEQSAREIPLIYTLAEVAGADALPVILPIAESGSAEARLAAADVLGQIGDGRAVPALLQAAQAPGNLGKTALESLYTLEGDGVDDAIAGGLADAQGPVRVVLLRLIGYRRIGSAVPELLKAADGDDAEVRLAALGALGRTVDFARLDVLIQRLVKPKDAAEAATAKTALRMAATRMSDRNATAAKLLAAFPDASTETKVALVELLAAVGGETAIAGVSKAASQGEDPVRDAATRVLGQWMSPDVAPELLKLAKTLDNGLYRLRALRGYLRIARQFQVPLEQRTEMAREALKLAPRLDEKKLALEVLTRYPSAEGLKLAAGELSNPRVKADAAAAAVAIAEKIIADDPSAVAAAMKQVAAAGVDQSLAAKAAALAQQAEKQK